MIQQHYSIQHLTTFKFPCTAEVFATFDSEASLIELLKQVPPTTPFMVLGGGSNVLFSPKYSGWILHNRCKGITLQNCSSSSVTIKVGAGEAWHDFVLYCVENGYYGIENLSLIPGTVGASPIQNIGAYGVEVKDVIESVEGISLPTFERKTLYNKDCCFGYRDSIFKKELKGKFIITSVTFTLSLQKQLNTEYGAIQSILKEMQIEQPTLKDISHAVITIRQSKLPDPSVIGNAGSFFKNPEITTHHFASLQSQFPTLPHYPGSRSGYIKIPAGWLIEKAGWKGKRKGNVGVHDKQALVLVNYGEGIGSELISLSKEIQQDVWEKFSIRLEAEVNIV